MAGDEVWGFSGPVADHILKNVGLTPPTTLPDQTNDLTAMRIGYTTAGATARSGTTLGAGTADIYYLAESGTNRVLTSEGYDVTFYNLSTTTVGATKYIQLFRHGAEWICNWEDC